MERVDVAVVGGGPAGSSAGRAAASQGAKTVVIEKGVPRVDRDEPGPDSTDAAGMLDYWVEIMGMEPDEIPDRVKQQELSGARFYGPNESVTLKETPHEAAYPNFGFTFDRVEFDNWLRERAESAGATYRVGNGVKRVEIDPRNGHTLELQNGEQLQAEYLILADGPQRTVTNQVLDPLLPDGTIGKMATPEANHIAYQEYRRFPEELFEREYIDFWWGHIPGHTAYPWVFPNKDRIARVGLTMPIGLDLDAIDRRNEYHLLRDSDESVPSGSTYIRRLLEHAYPEYDVNETFPLVPEKGKQDGTETYPISSTLPIDSPTGAKIAVTGGAMGTTSAFHEGGDHVAVRSGSIAGRLAARDELASYNTEWKRAIGDEIRQNAAFADVVRGYTPTDWDHTFSVVSKTLTDGEYRTRNAVSTGLSGIALLGSYAWRKFTYRSGRYVQIGEDEYSL